jgi:hypothetical protein
LMTEAAKARFEFFESGHGHEVSQFTPARLGFFSPFSSSI